MCVVFNNKTFSLPMMASTFLVSICCINCNNDTSKPLPSFNLILLKTASAFNTSQIPKGEPFALLFISAQCEHCNEETSDILNNIPSFGSTKFYVIGDDDLGKLENFSRNHNLQNYKSIVVCRDADDSFKRQFKPEQVPYLVVYDKEKKLRAVFSGRARVEQIAEAIKGL